jgi:hypothetical protein
MLDFPQRREVVRSMLAAATAAASAGCISITTKSELPATWRSAIKATGVANISGSYASLGERFDDGRMRPINLSSFLPSRENRFTNPAIYRFQQIDARQLEVFDASAEKPSLVLAVRSNPRTSEVGLPQFSDRGVSESMPHAEVVHVTLIRGRDSALYARSTTSGVAMFGPVPMVGSGRTWARFPPAPR